MLGGGLRVGFRAAHVFARPKRSDLLADISTVRWRHEWEALLTIVKKKTSEGDDDASVRTDYWQKKASA